MAVLGATAVHLDLPEAPHRGYGSAAELFAGVRGDDDVWREVSRRLAGLDAELWLAPQGLGGHVDHLQVGRAVAALDRPVLWWRDSPYVLRDPGARPGPHVPAGLTGVRTAQDGRRRAHACACYASQLGFQFGGEEGMRAALAGLDELLLAGPAARALLGACELPQNAAAGGMSRAQPG
jgi:LmbE family N-acetylglucosaminyl deacetylase